MDAMTASAYATGLRDHRTELFQEMLGATPSNIRNDFAALMQWLMVFERWSLPEIASTIPEIIRERAK